MQACQLTDGDLELLEPLAELQQLHVADADPWLLSDAALLETCAQAMPHLRLLTRDGKQLWQAVRRRSSSDSSKDNSLWPAGSLLDDLQEQERELPWLWHAANQGQAHQGLRGVHQPLAQDERYRYSTEQLLELRSGVDASGAEVGDAHGLPQLPDELRASVRW
jgi:hypothetical protein